MFGIFKKKKPPQDPPKRFPPVPDWQPEIELPIDELIDRIKFYTSGKRDIAVFQYGTLVILEDNLSDEQAELYALDVLNKIYNVHPDMKPINMKDGNILVQYNHPAVNIVLERIAAENWKTIDENHQRALATSEVLITPLGSNTFDEFGKKALFGRCYMFKDAQSPKVIKIIRKDI